jgi:hypothetical protein
VASRRSPPRATTRRPRGRASRGFRRLRRGLPLGRRVVGLRQIDGMPHSFQRARSSVVVRQQKASRPPARHRRRVSPGTPSVACANVERPKIRPCSGRRTSSRVRTQQDTTRTNQQVRADPPPDHRRQAVQVKKSRASLETRRPYLQPQLAGVQVMGSSGSSDGLIFGLIRVRSFAFSGVRISATMQVTDAGGAWRTRILSPENRKVAGSNPPDRFLACNEETEVLCSLVASKSRVSPTPERPRPLPSWPTLLQLGSCLRSQLLCRLLDGSGSLLAIFLIFSWILLKISDHFSKIDYELQDFARSVRPCPIPSFIFQCWNHIPCRHRAFIVPGLDYVLDITPPCDQIDVKMRLLVPDFGFLR